MRIETSAQTQNCSPLVNSHRTAQTRSDKAGTDFSSVIRELDDELTEMKVKLKNGEVEKKIQIGNTSYTDKDWNRLIAKFDATEDAIKKETAENTRKAEEEATGNKIASTKQEVEMPAAKVTDRICAQWNARHGKNGELSI